jgi:hypothetical protein
MAAMVRRAGRLAAAAAQVQKEILGRVQTPAGTAATVSPVI